MCDICENKLEDADDKDLLLASLGIIGGLMESYVEDGYCDPQMYKAIKLAKMIADKVGIQELTDHFSVLLLEAGEVVTHLIKINNFDIKDEEWQ